VLALLSRTCGSVTTRRRLVVVVAVATRSQRCVHQSDSGNTQAIELLIMSLPPMALFARRSYVVAEERREKAAYVTFTSEMQVDRERARRCRYADSNERY